MSERTPVPSRLRYEVMRRDSFTCRYCRRSDAPLTIDHVVPVVLGGQTVPENLVTCCDDCNAGKTSSAPDAPLAAAVSEDALRWAAAMRQAAVTQSERREEVAAYCAAFDAAWSFWSYSDGSAVPRPPEWRTVVENWHHAGLDLDALSALIADVLPRSLPPGRVWRCFCAAVRNLLRERQVIAQALVAAQAPSVGVEAMQ